MLLKLESLFVIWQCLMAIILDISDHFYSSLENVKDWTNCDSNHILFFYFCTYSIFTSFSSKAVVFMDTDVPSRVSI